LFWTCKNTFETFSNLYQVLNFETLQVMEVLKNWQFNYYAPLMIFHKKKITNLSTIQTFCGSFYYIFTQNIHIRYSKTSFYLHPCFIMGRIKYQGLHNIMQLTKENRSINIKRACIFELCWWSYLYITSSSILHQPSHFLTPTYCHHCPLQYQNTKKWLQIITLLWFDYMIT
jgi:hypothetical protein